MLILITLIIEDVCIKCHFMVIGQTRKRKMYLSAKCLESADNIIFNWKSSSYLHINTLTFSCLREFIQLFPLHALKARPTTV